MELQLKGKRALVTGSNSGIGAAIAKTLAQEGAIVVVHGRREEATRRVANEIEAAGGKAFVAIGDLGTDEGAQQVVDTVLDRLGGVDILVNNAGVFWFTPWLDTTAAEWNDIYNQNVGSMIRLTNALVPGMKERGWGRVIAISSGVGQMPFADAGPYSATKGANVSLAVSLAKALAGTGITSNTVSPGPILTEGFEEMSRKQAAAQGVPYDIEAAQKAFLTGAPNPVGRFGRPEEVADAVTFLASPRASFINGANLRVDGGSVPVVN